MSGEKENGQTRPLIAPETGSAVRCSRTTPHRWARRTVLHDRPPRTSCQGRQIGMRIAQHKGCLSRYLLASRVAEIGCLWPNTQRKEARATPVPTLRASGTGRRSCLSLFGSRNRRFTGRLRIRPIVPPGRAARCTSRRRRCGAGPHRRRSGVHVLGEEAGSSQARPTSSRCPSCTRRHSADVRDDIANRAFTGGALDATHRGLGAHRTGGQHGQEGQVADAPCPARITVPNREARGTCRAATPRRKDDLQRPPPYPKEGARRTTPRTARSRGQPRGAGTGTADAGAEAAPLAPHCRVRGPHCGGCTLSPRGNDGDRMLGPATADRDQKRSSGRAPHRQGRLPAGRSPRPRPARGSRPFKEQLPEDNRRAHARPIVYTI